MSTLAGSAASGFVDGVGTAARFASTRSITASSNGVLYVGGNGAVRMVTTSGSVSTLAGKSGTGYADGVGTNTAFNYINGLTVDSSDTVFAADLSNNVIRKVLSSG